MGGNGKKRGINEDFGVEKWMFREKMENLGVKRGILREKFPLWAEKCGFKSKYPQIRKWGVEILGGKMGNCRGKGNWGEKTIIMGLK